MKKIGLILLCGLLGSLALAQEDIWEREISEDEVYTFLDKNIPLLSEELRETQADFPEEYEIRMLDTINGIRHYYEVKQYDPQAAENMLEVHRMEFQCGQLADRVVAEKDPVQKEQFTRELEGKLLMVFDLHLAENQQHAEMLRRELAEIETMLNQRKAVKNRIIQRRLEELIAERDETLQWW